LGQTPETGFKTFGAPEGNSPNDLTLSGIPVLQKQCLQAANMNTKLLARRRRRISTSIALAIAGLTIPLVSSARADIAVIPFSGSGTSGTLAPGFPWITTDNGPSGETIFASPSLGVPPSNVWPAPLSLGISPV